MFTRVAKARPARHAFIDQGHTGPEPAQAAAAQGIELHVVKLPQAKRGFAWAARFRRLARDYERLTTTLEGTH